MEKQAQKLEIPTQVRARPELVSQSMEGGCWTG